MKLKNWIKQVDSLSKVKIWGLDDKAPLFEGWIDEIPWTIVDYEIGRMNTTNIIDEPIYISIYTNEYGAIMPLIVINVIEKE